MSVVQLFFGRRQAGLGFRDIGRDRRVGACDVELCPGCGQGADCLVVASLVGRQLRLRRTSLQIELGLSRLQRPLRLDQASEFALDGAGPRGLDAE